MNNSTIVQRTIIAIQIFVIISLTVMIFKQGGVIKSKDDEENNEGNTAQSLSVNDSSEGLDNDSEEDEYDDVSSGDYSAIIAVEDIASSDPVDALQDSEEMMEDEELGGEVQNTDSNEEDNDEASKEESGTIVKNEETDRTEAKRNYEDNKTVIESKGVVDKTLEYISNMIEPWLEPVSDDQEDDNTNENNAAPELSDDNLRDEGGQEGQSDSDDWKGLDEWVDQNGQKEDEYILFDSNTRYYTKEEIEMLDDWTLQMAINELYARHGRKFDLKSIRDYFEGKSWYEGVIEPKDFDGHEEELLNDYEEKNRKIMVEVRNARKDEK